MIRRCLVLAVWSVALYLIGARIAFTLVDAYWVAT